MTQPNNRSTYLGALIRGRLWLQVLVGMSLGIMIGTLLGPSVGLVGTHTAQIIGNWLAFPGRLFLALIQMIVIPLVFASIITGLTSSKSMEQLRSMGIYAVAFFLLTTFVAIVIGVSLAYAIQPGEFISNAQALASAESQPITNDAVPLTPKLSELPNQIILLLPVNPLSSMVEGQMLQIVVFAIVLGAAMVGMPQEKSRILIDFLASLQEVCMTIVKWAMWLAPFAVFGLLAQLTSSIGLEVLIGMGIYILTVLAGLLLLFGLYVLIVVLFAGLAPLPFLRQIREVLLLAFSTSSSAAVMPLSIKTAEEKFNVRPSVSKFVIPLGATINMNGTALYQGVAAIFLAQVYRVDLHLGGIMLLILTAVGASIGSPATPGVGIIILSMVLYSVGIPTSGIALIIGVDRILDMSRTAANVCGDLVATILVDKRIRERGIGSEIVVPNPHDPHYLERS